MGEILKAALLAPMFVAALAVAAPQNTTEAAHSEVARIDWHQVAAPFGRFMLIRGQEGICAIRFLDYQHGDDAKAPNTFHSGAAHESSAYEWYFLKAWQGQFGDPQLAHGQARVGSGPLVGIGRLAFATSDSIVRCGPMKNFWLPRGALSFSDKVSCKAARYQIAPTRWSTIADVDRSDERLKWFQCETGRKTFTLPLSEL